MKQIPAMIFAIIIGFNSFAQHKSHISLDMGSILKGESINLSAGYGFSSRWSVSWKTEMNMQILRAEHDKEYMAHISEFSDNTVKSSPPYGNSISIQYWPDSVYEGAWLEAGCRCTEKFKADCVIGVGYMIHVWKGLKTVLSYQTDLLSSLKEGRSSGTGLTLGIYWIITY